MLGLRNFVEADREKVREWRNAPEVANHMYGDHVIGEAEHNAWFRSLGTDDTRYYWMIIHSGRDVGVAYLFDLDRHNSRAYWGFYLAPGEARGAGTGYMVEIVMLCLAFEHLALNKLCCEVFEENDRVWRMHEKVGFVREGVFRNHIRKAGTFRNVVALAMLRDEWLAIREDLMGTLARRGQSLPDFTTLIAA